MNSEGTSSLQTLKRNGHLLFYFGMSQTNQQGYWRDVGTLDSYYDASMELLASDLKPRTKTFILPWCADTRLSAAVQT